MVLAAHWASSCLKFLVISSISVLKPAPSGVASPAAGPSASGKGVGSAPAASAAIEPGRGSSAPMAAWAAPAGSAPPRTSQVMGVESPTPRGSKPMMSKEALTSGENWTSLFSTIATPE